MKRKDKNGRTYVIENNVVRLTSGTYNQEEVRTLAQNKRVFLEGARVDTTGRPIYRNHKRIYVDYVGW